MAKKALTAIPGADAVASLHTDVLVTDAGDRFALSFAFALALTLGSGHVTVLVDHALVARLRLRVAMALRAIVISEAIDALSGFTVADGRTFAEWVARKRRIALALAFALSFAFALGPVLPLSLSFSPVPSFSFALAAFLRRLLAFRVFASVDVPLDFVGFQAPVWVLGALPFALVSAALVRRQRRADVAPAAQGLLALRGAAAGPTFLDALIGCAFTLGEIDLRGRGTVIETA
jgi:hypothetical protein